MVPVVYLFWQSWHLGMHSELTPLSALPRLPLGTVDSRAPWVPIAACFQHWWASGRAKASSLLCSLGAGWENCLPLVFFPTLPERRAGNKIPIDIAEILNKGHWVLPPLRGKSSVCNGQIRFSFLHSESVLCSSPQTSMRPTLTQSPAPQE